MKRIGCVLVFREGLTPEEAAAELEKIRGALELPEKTPHYIPNDKQRSLAVDWQPFQMVDKIEHFDDEQGGPVWYIP